MQPNPPHPMTSHTHHGSSHGKSKVKVDINTPSVLFITSGDGIGETVGDSEKPLEKKPKDKKTLDATFTYTTSMV
jgi:hypothetical protein